MGLTGGVFLSALLAFAQPQSQIGRPGMVNYVEGQVSIDGQAVANNQVGRLEVAPGHVLKTDDGKAEMLLTPGVFLRLDSHSSVKMISSSLSKMTVELLQGKSMVEADQVEKENHLTVLDRGSSTLLEKHGIYEFNADNPMVAVYDGKAQVQADDRTKDLWKGQEIVLTQNPKLKSKGFNPHKGDDLYDWSKLRSEYTAEVNNASAQNIAMADPSWFYGMGWYWDPWFDSWAFVPGYGFGYSPFGFGFYSPGYWGGMYGRGMYGRGYYGSRYGFGGRPANAGGYRGGMGGFHGGGMGGFHGGGMGGGRR
jgi:hypothetical protein